MSCIAMGIYEVFDEIFESVRGLTPENIIIRNDEDAKIRGFGGLDTIEEG